MGFEKDVLKEGNGTKPKKGNTVTVHCTGYGKNGNCKVPISSKVGFRIQKLSVPFWSTKDAGQQPFTFVIGMGQVIKAWDEGVMTMSIGEKAVIKATADYAYGAGGFPAWGIMPNSPLNFEIEVLSIK